MSRLRILFAFSFLSVWLVGCRAAWKTDDRCVPLPEELAFRLNESQILELILVQPGTFWMGSPADEPGRDPDERRHRVRITKPFYLGKYEVTQGQWAAVMGQNPSFFHGSDRLPVDSVDWNASIAFCKKLSNDVGRAVRLPTEAEWEYACRAGTQTPYSFGSRITKYDANFDWTHGGAQPGDYHEITMSVGNFAPNARGFFDMHGNVREWCADWYARSYPPGDVVIDPTGPSTGTIHVLRGGSWEDYAHRCRSAYRGGYKPGDRDECNGLRICVETDG